MRLGFVGLGVMGTPMARNLLRAGHDLVVYDVVSDKRTALEADGAVAAADLGHVAEAAEVIILMLPGPREIEEAVGSLVAAGDPGTIIVDMSTSDPGLDVELAHAAEANGLRYLDAPVSRAVDAAAAGELLIMVGGEPETFETCRPLFEVLGTDIHHCGPVGSGHKLKLLNNLKIMSEVAVIAEVIAVARADGLDLDMVRRVLGLSSAASFMWEYQAGRMVDGAYEPGFPVAMGLKDLTLALTWADRAGLHLDVGTAARDAYARGVETGIGARDTAALVDTVR